VEVEAGAAGAAGDIAEAAVVGAAVRRAAMVAVTRVVEVPRRVVEVPRRGVEIPRRVVEVPRRVVEVPRRVVEVPRRVVEVPRRGVEIPRRVVEVPRRGARSARATDALPSTSALRSIGLPDQLELEFLFLSAALMLDIEGGVRWDVQPLAADLDRERVLRLDRIGEPTELGNELGAGVGLGEIAVGHGEDLSKLMRDRNHIHLAVSGSRRAREE
jgi:hypothetical protein